MWNAKKQLFGPNSMVGITLLTTVVLVLLVSALSAYGAEKEPLTIYGGRGLRAPLEEIRSLYEQENNVKTHIVYSGSNSLLKAIKMSGRGDIYIPGSSHFIEENRELLGQTVGLAFHVPVVAIHRENPKNLTTFTDLAAEGVRIALGNKDMCAIGRLAENIIDRSGLGAKLRPNVAILPSTANELLVLVSEQQVDAAIVWLDMLQLPEATHLTFFNLPPELSTHKLISATILKSSRHREAKHFLTFLSQQGRAIFEKHGYPLVQEGTNPDASQED